MADLMEKEATNQSQVQLQDSMWIEIIRGME